MERWERVGCGLWGVRWVLALWVAAAGATGCGALKTQSPSPEWQTRVDDLVRSQSRTEMRLDELTRNLLVLRERLEAQEGALKRLAEEGDSREEPVVPALSVVKVEPVDGEAPRPGGRGGAEAATEKEAFGEQAGARVKRGDEGEPRPSDLYRRAYSGFRDGRFGQAILDFEEFLRRYPGHEYADNAQYWIGECYYSQREFGEAVVEFGRVVERYPRDGKAPDALLKIGLAYQQLGEMEKAKAFWKRLVSEYPAADGAAQAKKLLSAPP